MAREQSAMPRFEIGDTVRYQDHHGREQLGSVLRIEATWTANGDAPWISYTLTHPTYRKRRTYAAEKNMTLFARAG